MKPFMGSSSAERSAFQRVPSPKGAHMLPEPSTTNTMLGMFLMLVTIALAQTSLPDGPAPTRRGAVGTMRPSVELWPAFDIADALGEPCPAAAPRRAVGLSLALAQPMLSAIHTTIEILHMLDCRVRAVVLSAGR